MPHLLLCAVACVVVLTIGSLDAYAANATEIAALRKAADQGDSGAQVEYGVLFVTGDGVAQDSAEALKWFRKSAAQGDPGAQYLLGWMYAGGNGVSQDYAQAAEWFLKGADQGHVNSQFNLGLLYIEGLGVPQDYVIAYMSLTIAAAYDVPNAQVLRDKLEPEMTPEQISKAMLWAREWNKKHPSK